MSMAIFARSFILRQQAFARARSFHTTSVARSDHGHYHHLPFQFPGKNKAPFAAKVFVYLATGFAIPFVAAKWQLTKSQSA
ncbi:hypothetical protein E4T56_gene16325 [Termitomyces sp. T112]|nr:hypothetical protein E4T56_gene16325 [Termitomyces sp. T112]KAH0587470.1 hypothetical protein H2248_006254 [Termitomyces sp. 'cryptogamus']